MRKSSETDALIDALTELSNQDMLEVLQAVFARRIPYEPEQDFQTSHYVLSVTSNVRLDDWEDGEDGLPAEEWSGWNLRVVGDYDKESYPEVAAGEIELGSGEFDQRGMCRTCQTPVASIAKRAICPVCGAKVFLM